MKLFSSKAFKVISIIVLSIVLLWSVFAIIPPKKVIDNNPFIIEDKARPMIAAHRGGKNLNPENTFKAFDYSINNLDIDILELDLCMTKDEELVIIHNKTINSCTDVEIVNNTKEEYAVLEHTLAELQIYNFGYNFQNSEGEYPYRDLLDNVLNENRSEVLRQNKLRIVTINELFEAYKNTDLLFIVEIKDEKEVGYKAADKLYKQMEDNNLLKRVVVGTFHTEIEDYLEKEYPSVMRGGSVGGVTNFVITQMFGVNIFDNSNFCCLQIPVSRKAAGITIKLDKKTYIRRAHRRNISVQFWTINDKEEMRRLIEMGADVIMTDSPDILHNLLIEMGY